MTTILISYFWSSRFATRYVTVFVFFIVIFNKRQSVLVSLGNKLPVFGKSVVGNYVYFIHAIVGKLSQLLLG